jgi:hypothetical protein
MLVLSLVAPAMLQSALRGHVLMLADAAMYPFNGLC